MGHVVANITNDDSVPKNSCWLGNCVEELAGEMGLTLLAYFAEAGTDGGSFESWVRGWGGDDDLRRRMGSVIVCGGG